VNKLLLTTGEAAEVLGVGRTTVYELLNAGLVESVRIGRARRIPRAALVVYVDRLRGLSGGQGEEAA
jgi:excisionase family DNA binding protein